MAAEIPDGAFIVARAIFNSSLWTMRDQDRILAVTLIGIANWRDRRWFDGKASITIKRGQLVRSLKELTEAAHLSLQTVRTALSHLEKSEFLTRDSTRGYQLITIPKYAHYQDLAKYSDGEAVRSNTKANTKSTRTQHRPNTGSTRGQHDPNNKQEGEEGDKGKEGEEGRPLGVFEMTTPQDATTVTLMRLAISTACCPSQPATIRKHLEALVQRKDVGIQKLEAYLYSEEARGLTVNHWQDHFKRNGNGTSSQEALERWAHEQDIKAGRTEGSP